MIRTELGIDCSTQGQPQAVYTGNKKTIAMARLVRRGALFQIRYPVLGRHGFCNGGYKNEALLRWDARV